MAKDILNPSREDYLEAVLVINSKKGICYSIDVANYLGFSKPSVSTAVKKLESQNMLKRDSKGVLSLTEEGLQIANKMYERHVTLTDYLVNIGVSPETAEKDACSIEHLLSDETFDAIKNHKENR